MRIFPERCPGCDCIAHPDPCSSTGCDCHVELWSPSRIRTVVIDVKTVVRLSRLTALGLSMGMPPRTACAHAMEAENLKNYAAALGYTPGDVAGFLEQGLSIEQTKYRMTLGDRP